MFKKLFGQKENVDSQQKAEAIRQERLLKAQQGEFAGWTCQTALEIDGAHCLVYSNQQFTLRLDEAGCHLSDLVFYRSASSAKIGGSMQSATLTSAVATAATTETYALDIPWGDIQICLENSMPEFRVNVGNQMDNGSHFRILRFANRIKNREEWIGFGICMAQDDPIQELFTSALTSHQIALGDFKAYQNAGADAQESEESAFKGAGCDICHQHIEGELFTFPEFVGTIGNFPIRYKAVGLYCLKCRQGYCLTHKKELKITFGGGFEKAVCPDCGTVFGLGRVIMKKK